MWMSAAERTANVSTTVTTPWAVTAAPVVMDTRSRVTTGVWVSVSAGKSDKHKTKQHCSTHFWRLHLSSDLKSWKSISFSLWLKSLIWILLKCSVVLHSKYDHRSKCKKYIFMYKNLIYTGSLTVQYYYIFAAHYSAHLYCSVFLFKSNFYFKAH